MTRRLFLSFVVAGICLASRGAAAHHSFAATYLPDQMVTVRGEIQQVLFRNPHSFIRLVVRDADGAQLRYAVEWVGAAQLGTDGITEGTLKPGDIVVVTGNPGRNAADHTIRMNSLYRPKDGFTWSARPDKGAN